MTAAKISSHADHAPSDYRFARTRQDWLYVPLLKSEAPLKSWAPHAVAAAFLVLLFIAAFVLPSVIVWAGKP